MEDPENDTEFSRPPLIGDLVELCRELNRRGADYIVIGGMAVNIHGHIRNTEDIDLMAKSCGHEYRDVNEMITPVVVEGVTIPFASPALLWKTKQTFREKDAWDCTFLKKLLIERGEWPVE